MVNQCGISRFRLAKMTLLLIVVLGHAISLDSSLSRRSVSYVHLILLHELFPFMQQGKVLLGTSSFAYCLNFMISPKFGIATTLMGFSSGP